MSETLSKCNRCGAPLPPDAPEGLCPRCLVALNLATQTEVTGETDPHGPAVPKPPPAPVSEIAKLFPQLEILECLGRGGMGAVYKARQPRLDRLVALKILSPEKQGDSKFAERFEREARTLARLHHPNIVTVYDFGEVQGNYYLLMEFVDGLTLRQLLQTGKIAPAEALNIVPKICEALQYAHEQGIIHRDIKPENILLDKQGRVKIADFGIAKIMEGRDALPRVQADQQVGPTNLTEAGQVVGTPHYMAPEQIEKPQTVDHRADIYSLGVVFYEMLTGELPLGKFQPPSKKVQIDVRLDEVVLRALAKEPERRYQQASQVKTAVETIAQTPPPSSSGRESAPSESQSRLTLAATTKKTGWWLCSPLASPEVREIAAHLTKVERSEAALYGLLWGVWVLVPSFGNFYLIRSNPAPGSWIVASVIVALFIATVPPMIRMQRRFLCSTAWAKERGFNAEQIKLFSFSRRNLWLVLLFVGVGALFIFAQGKLIMYYSGTSELLKSINGEIAQSKRLSAQLLAVRHKAFYIGQAYFPKGDSIEITSVKRIKDQMTVKGHYNLVSHDNAELAYITSTNRNFPEDTQQRMQISKGLGDFELIDSHLVPGLPHVSMYADGKSFAALYFGTKAEALEESKAGWITNEAPATVTTDQIIVEHAAMRMLAAIRDKDDDALKELATERVKGWRESLPQFAFEMREKFHELTGKPFDMHVSESLVRDDTALVKCAGPKELNGIYLALFFIKTEDGWKNCWLHNAPPSVPLEDFWRQMPPAATTQLEDAAVSAAQKWLALIDAGSYSESWKEASAIFQGAVTEPGWENSMNTFRKLLGDLVSRKLKSAERMTEMPGAPDGQYVLMQFETSFINKKSAIETVTFMLGKDGQWRAAGYYIK
jgi:serine/threonine protein kinase